ncbi:MAG: hypothetical protein LQ340_003869 [Diploschistes diacapsis]|nr:MAG: hypothetical protein LQ340_003869 [Diploschistes diacapsis]
MIGPQVLQCLPNGLENLLERFRDSGCTELRDKVYGLLGLANDVTPFSKTESSLHPIKGQVVLQGTQSEASSRRNVGPFQVDYSRSFYDIWTDVVKYLFFQAKGTEARLSTQTKPQLPKRVLEKRASLPRAKRRLSIVRASGIVQEAFGSAIEKELVKTEFPKARSTPTPPTDRLAGDYADEHKRPQDNTIIRAIGFVTGEIVHLGPHYSALAAELRAQQDWIASWDDHYGKATDIGMLRKINEDYTARILDYEEDYLGMVREIRSCKTAVWPVTEDTTSEAVDLEREQDTRGDNAAEQPQGPRICLGTNQVIALLPSAARVGDVIVQFWHCDAAMVMRSVPRPASSSSIGAPDGPTPAFKLVGRANVADNSVGKDSPEHDPDNDEGSGALKAVHVDLDLPTLQTITASIVSRMV